MRTIVPCLAVALLVVSCSSDQAGGNAPAGSGGAETGGSPAATGGSPSSGGTRSSGGASGSGGTATGGSGTGGAAGSGGGATDAGSGGGASDAGPTVEAGTGGKVSPVEGCQYQGIETANCESGKTNYWECGASTSTDSPDPSCVRPTTGPNLATRWCCAEPFCSKISVVEQVCSQVYPASPHGYSCDPDLAELSLCRKQAGNGACCPF